MPTVDVRSPNGDVAGTVELPASVFDAAVNVPLVHQVVVAQLAAARQGTHDTKTRGEVRGGGRKPYRQKGTGRARQGSNRSPQFVGGGTVHGPTPRSYAQRTPKKMKAAALRAALSDRARGGRLHVVSALVEGDAPSTKAAATALATIATSRHVLAVIERTDLLNWKSLRNLPTVHVIAPDQLNTYDVLVADDVVFTEGALAAFVGERGEAGDAIEITKPAKKTAAKKATAKRATKEASAVGETKPAGEGVPDEQAVAEVAEQTSSDLKAQDVFERESDGASSDAAAKDTDADEVAD